MIFGTPQIRVEKKSSLSVASSIKKKVDKRGKKSVNIKLFSINYQDF